MSMWEHVNKNKVQYGLTLVALFGVGYMMFAGSLGKANFFTIKEAPVPDDAKFLSEFKANPANFTKAKKADWNSTTLNDDVKKAAAVSAHCNLTGTVTTFNGATDPKECKPLFELKTTPPASGGVATARVATQAEKIKWLGKKHDTVNADLVLTKRLTDGVKNSAANAALIAEKAKIVKANKDYVEGYRPGLWKTAATGVTTSIAYLTGGYFFGSSDKGKLPNKGNDGRQKPNLNKKRPGKGNAGNGNPDPNANTNNGDENKDGNGDDKPSKAWIWILIIAAVVIGVGVAVYCMFFADKPDDEFDEEIGGELGDEL